MHTLKYNQKEQFTDNTMILLQTISNFQFILSFQIPHYIYETHG
jgi:hypothetical protein